MALGEATCVFDPQVKDKWSNNDFPISNASSSPGVPILSGQFVFDKMKFQEL